MLVNNDFDLISTYHLLLKGKQKKTLRNFLEDKYKSY